MAEVRRAGVPILMGQRLVAFEGRDGVEAGRRAWEGLLEASLQSVGKA